MTSPELAFHATHSAPSNPGNSAGAFSPLPTDLATIREAILPLVFHYRADGDWSENGIAPERIAEVNLRYADAMLARLQELTNLPLGESRAPVQRIVGCCRDWSLLMVAACRSKGIPARSRTGFAACFMPGWYLDHTVAEVWDASDSRWRLIDAELRPGHRNPTTGAEIDPLDLPREIFLTSNDAWNLCRSGTLDPERFVVHPDLEIPQLRGWAYLRHNLVVDLAALNNHEMLLWDVWGVDLVDEPTEDNLSLLNDVANATTFEERTRLFAHPDLSVPPVVTSFTPETEGTPIQVTLR